jgi:malonate decarboxylase alpha subunit
MRDWNSRTRNREARLERSAALAKGKVVAAEDIGALFETIL